MFKFAHLITLFLLRGDEKVNDSIDNLYLIESSDYTAYEKTLPWTNKQGFKKFKWVSVLFGVTS